MKSQENPHKGSKPRHFIQQNNNFFSETTDPVPVEKDIGNDNISYES